MRWNEFDFSPLVLKKGEKVSYAEVLERLELDDFDELIRATSTMVQTTKVGNGDVRTSNYFLLNGKNSGAIYLFVLAEKGYLHMMTFKTKEESEKELKSFVSETYVEKINKYLASYY